MRIFKPNAVINVSEYFFNDGCPGVRCVVTEDGVVTLTSTYPLPDANLFIIRTWDRRLVVVSYGEIRRLLEIKDLEWYHFIPEKPIVRINADDVHELFGEYRTVLYYIPYTRLAHYNLTELIECSPVTLPFIIDFIRAWFFREQYYRIPNISTSLATDHYVINIRTIRDGAFETLLQWMQLPFVYNPKTSVYTINYTKFITNKFTIKKVLHEQKTI